MKRANALLAAWIVVIAGLLFAIVFFSMQGQAPPPSPVPDAPVTPVKPAAKPPARTPPTVRTGGGRNRSGTSDKQPRQLEIKGIVRGPDTKPVEGAHVAIFPPARPGQPADPPNMEHCRLISSVLYIAPEDWDLPRPLESWTGVDTGGPEPGETEIAGADTQADGTFVIVVPQHTSISSFRLTASKEGVGNAAMPDVGIGNRVDLTLGTASAVRGTVIAEVGGAPVGGARVTFDNGTRRLAVVTNAEGRFALENIVPGTYRLSVAAKGMTPLFENRFRIAANDPTPYTLRMPRGTLLRVKAVVENPGADTGRHGNRPEGEPVPGAKIVVLCEDTYAYVIGTTNQQGIVEFPGLPAGKYTMNGLAPGFVPFAETTAMIDKKDLVQEETVQFETAVDTPIEVVDEEGRPVAGMEFFGANADDRYDALRSMKAGVTDGDGKLKFAFESDGPRAALYGFKPGYAMVRACPDDYESGDPLRVVAKKPIRVHGRVATPDGRGIADAVVAISISASEQNPNEDDVELEIRTNAEGQYDFPFLPHSDGITITATAPDGISEDEKDLEVVAGRTDYTVDITIELEDAGSTPPPKKK